MTEVFNSGYWALTTESPISRYGVPVLRQLKPFRDGCFNENDLRPSDTAWTMPMNGEGVFAGVSDVSEHVWTAGEVVASAVNAELRSASENGHPVRISESLISAAAKFCNQWPEGPQVNHSR